MIKSPAPTAIAAARSDAGHTQAQAAACLGECSKPTWQAWEYGKRPMSGRDFALYKHLAGLEQIPFVARQLPAYPAKAHK